MADLDSRPSTSSATLTPRLLSYLEHTPGDLSRVEGLIKSVPNTDTLNGQTEKLLIDFYLHGICPGRTPAAASNPYISALQVATSVESTRYAILGLSAAYIKSELQSERECYQRIELDYSIRALRALAVQINTQRDHDAAIMTSMLLMHHDAVHNHQSSLCWSVHANVLDTIPPQLFDQQSDAAIFLRSQIILAETVEPPMQPLQSRRKLLENMRWYDNISPSEAGLIRNHLGFSPQLIFLISSTTSLASNVSASKYNFAEIETHLNDLMQQSTEIQKGAHDILVATAETFKLAALIYLHCRLKW